MKKITITSMEVKTIYPQLLNGCFLLWNFLCQSCLFLHVAAGQCLEQLHRNVAKDHQGKKDMDGWKAVITRADGTVERVPNFSEPFPGQKLPAS